MSELEPTRTYSNHTATDKLRRLLDERGVEWSDDGYTTTCTVWVANGATWHGLWRDDCIELIAHLTPEQAIDATLGRGTCHAIEVPMGMHDDATATVCSACRVAIDELSEMNYCPNCGRRVEP